VRWRSRSTEKELADRDYGVIVIGLAVLLFPVLKRYNEPPALFDRRDQLALELGHGEEAGRGRQQRGQ
jgi:hypothetical protein